MRPGPQVERSTPKKSVSCVSVRVVLVMSEPIRLVFIGLLHLLFLLYVGHSRSHANFREVPEFGGFRISSARFTAESVAGCFRVTRFPERDGGQGNTV